MSTKPLNIVAADYPLTISFNVNRYELHNASGAMFSAGTKQQIKAELARARIDTARVRNTVPVRWMSDK